MASALTGCNTTAAKHDYTLDIPPDTQLLAIDVENFKGSVEIRAGKGKPGQARVTSEVLTIPGADKQQRQRAAENVDVTANIEENDGRAVLRIRTDNAQRRGAQEVDIYVEVPRCDGLRVINRGGTVEAVGTAGATHIENREGAVELRTNQVMDRDVTILVVDGNIYYQVAPGSKGVFDLETLDGEVAMRDFTGMTSNTNANWTRLHTTVAKGDNPVMARTNKGDIRVWIMENPEALTRMIKKSPPSVDDYLFLDGSRRYTRNLPTNEPKPRGTRSNPGG